MRSLVRALLRGQGGSVGFRVGGHGPVAGPPVFAPAFGTPLAFKETGVARMPSSRCKQCNQPLVDIDNYGERIIGCIKCNRWTWRGSKQPIELPVDDLEALKLASRRCRT